MENSDLPGKMFVMMCAVSIVEQRPDSFHERFLWGAYPQMKSIRPRITLSTGRLLCLGGSDREEGQEKTAPSSQFLDQWKLVGFFNKSRFSSICALRPMHLARRFTLHGFLSLQRRCTRQGWGPLKGAWSAQTALEEFFSETRELIGGTEKMAFSRRRVIYLPSRLINVFYQPAPPPSLKFDFWSPPWWCSPRSSPSGDVNAKL